MADPKVKEDLLNILMRSHLHAIAFSADIAKMYRQVQLNHLDHDFRRFVRRKSPEEEIQDYRMKTVTLGVASLANYALRVLVQLANE